MNIIKGLLLRLRLLISRHTRRGGIYYVNGAATLPPPLEPAEESELICRLDKDPCDLGARGALIERNLRLVVFIARKFESTGYDIEDLVSIGTQGLIKAIKTFRPDKNIRLATYASRCIENEILMYMRKKNRRKLEMSLDEPLNIDWDGNELLLSDILGSDEGVEQEYLEREERRLVREAVSGLGERERRIIELRYGFDGGRELTQKEVADRLGISQSYISRLEKKIMGDLRLKLEGKI